MTFQEIIDKEKAISREEALQEGRAEERTEILQKLSVALGMPIQELQSIVDAKEQ